MSQDISDHLTFLYGPAQARAIEPRLRRILSEHQVQRGPTGRARRELTHRDVLVIAYGDQVRKAGEAPLRTLGSFLEAHAGNIVSAVHLLPFFPSSSDDGFSVIDYRAVDPDLGT